MQCDDGSQRYAIRGQVWAAHDPTLQEALAAVYASGERPRCLCMPGGIEMYVARHHRFVVKRMPETGRQHHPGCPSFEPDGAQSGLGALVGEAVLEREPGRVELRVDFPWSRIPGRSAARTDAIEPGEVQALRHRMSLRAVMHYLFERAGFNRWTPAMAGRRNQGVLHKYLLEAAGEIVVKGVSLADRLYVPEPFSETGKADAAQRRRAKLAVLRPHDGAAPLALVIGEFKSCETADQGRRVWIRHMPDAPLLVEERVWRRLQHVHAALLEARDADMGHRVRLMLAALIKARREFTYELDAASMMMLSEQWIPVEGVHELPLIDALIAQNRRFVKPLRYDAPFADAFANVLLLDAGAAPVPLHVLSPLMDARCRTVKQRCIVDAGAGVWAWSLDRDMPPLPPTAAVVSR